MVRLADPDSHSTPHPTFQRKQRTYLALSYPEMYVWILRCALRKSYSNQGLFTFPDMQAASRLVLLRVLVSTRLMEELA